jgi:L-rhamnose isomerase/sugar isomerase
VLRVQELYAKALLIDRAALRKAQAERDIVAVEEILQDAYQTAVRPMLRDWRTGQGLDPEPLQAFRRSGYLQAKAKERQARRQGTSLAIAASGTGFPR